MSNLEFLLALLIGMTMPRQQFLLFLMGLKLTTMGSNTSIKHYSWQNNWHKSIHCCFAVNSNELTLLKEKLWENGEKSGIRIALYVVLINAYLLRTIPVPFLLLTQSIRLHFK